jgi:CelD/BcsL family acetyltransferase involved in cellulose biosynthesis
MSYVPIESRPSTLWRSRASSNVTVTDTESGRLAVDLISPAELGQDLVDKWEGLRAKSGDLETPFFSSRFTCLVGQVRPQSKIAIFSRGGNVAGFLPFEYTSAAMIAPIAKRFNDAHGLICNPAAPLDYVDALRSLSAKAYRFHALAGPGVGASPYILGQTRSFLANLEAHPDGYVEYLETTRATIFKQRRKTKKMIKDLGPMRLEIDCRDENAFETLIQLKRNQYQRTYIYDLLGVPWAKEMLHTLWQEKQHRCRGLLSVLYAGDRIVAAHFGMLEGTLLHYWFPTYDPEYNAYSPGTAMFLEIAKEAPKIGVKKIDLGCGEQAYKHKFVDTITEMPHGCVTTNSLTYLKEASRQKLAKGIKQIPGKPMLKRILREVWPSFGQSGYA